MSKVVLDVSVSLNGFSAGPNGWVDTEVRRELDAKRATSEAVEGRS